jgi:hypothetical protein
MDLQQAGSAVAPAGRTESFNNGVSGTPTMVASGLSAQSQQFNDKVGRGVSVQSVLQGMPGMSGNGMSEEDKGHILPGGYQMGSANGMSQGDYEPAMRLRMLGARGEF